MKSTKEDGRPGFYWFPKDWMADTGLQSCSLTARGLWIEMINLMWLSPKRGYLLLQNSNKPTNKAIAILTRTTEKEVEVLLSELNENSVYSVDEDGVIYCRKILDLEHIRRVRAEAGTIGMSKRWGFCNNKKITGCHNKSITGTEIRKKKDEDVLEEKESMREKETPDTNPLKKLVEDWNLFAEGNKLTKVEVLSKDREKKLRCRLREQPFKERFPEILQGIEASAFLLGLKKPRKPDEKSFKVDFDWIIKNDTNYLKILEGKYKDEGRGANEEIIA